MVSPVDALTPKVQAALRAALGEQYAEVDPVIRPSQYADLQVNVALALAKQVGMPPRALATAVVEHLDLAEMASSVEVSGPGFINVTLSPEWISAAVSSVAADSRLGIPQVDPDIIPIDYSAPNVAKEMHVGHLRTTVVGDALARTLERLGHTVIRQNHVGDWGTNFGMLVEYLMEVGEDSAQAQLIETDPNTFYQNARNRFEASEEWANRARARVVSLQAGDAETLRVWRGMVEHSKRYFTRVYTTLGVTLTDADLAGESTYNDQLADICAELEAKGIATVSDGALCVFLDGYTGREGKPVPLIIRKSDGGYGYATTDLATVRYRVATLCADRILYVVGAPQSLHFHMVWAAARLAGWLPDSVTTTHVQIGNVLGPDKKLLRTREGAALKLMELLQEGIDKARAYVDQARPELPDAERAAIAWQVGIGAIKYADLSVAHDSEYVFDLDRMLALTGNTGPYLQYATTRVRSIFRSVGEDPDAPVWRATPIVVADPSERALALLLLGYGSVVSEVGAAYEPHRLCGYLFEVASAFSAFYEACPVLKAETDDVKASRMALSALTLRVLVEGLSLLGVESPVQM
ncbi:MAG TPA: arginine--tRNA ligase [Dermatophilaceae bacterium]|nr:arginine--tRNA ligase [Dermatophilaceae bacterium]